MITATNGTPAVPTAATRPNAAVICKAAPLSATARLYARPEPWPLAEEYDPTESLIAVDVGGPEPLVIPAAHCTLTTLKGNGEA